MMSQNVMHGKKSPKQRSRNMPAKPRQLDLLNQAKNMDQIRPKSRGQIRPKTQAKKNLNKHTNSGSFTCYVDIEKKTHLKSKCKANILYFGSCESLIRGICFCLAPLEKGSLSLGGQKRLTKRQKYDEGHSGMIKAPQPAHNVR